ncbi:MAG: CopG family transcriptional regulator [Fimbriimonadaceae bacterium]
MARATIYFPEDLIAELRKRAAASETSISKLVSDAVRSQFEEDTSDIAAYRARSEPVLSVSETRKHLKASGRL